MTMCTLDAIHPPDNEPWRWWSLRTPEEAWAGVPPERRGAAACYARWLHPVSYDLGEDGVTAAPIPDELLGTDPQLADLPARRGVRPPPGFEPIGFDAVEGYVRDAAAARASGSRVPNQFRFDCSPLLCNGMAQALERGGVPGCAGLRVNRWCLIDRLADAQRLAAAFAAGGAEPGPYVVVEVWRQAAAGSAGA